nr:zinc finger protein 668 [Hymenolepis microstoma]
MVCLNILLNMPFTVPYKCPSCSSTFDERRLLETHYDLTHGDGQARFCFRCGKLFATLQSYQRHCQFVHELPKPVRTLACEHCNQTFATPQALKVHTSRKHAG